jgi:hypothetical protein
MLSFQNLLNNFQFQQIVGMHNNKRSVYPITLESHKPSDKYLTEIYEKFDTNPNFWSEELEYMILSDMLQIWKSLRSLNGADNNTYKDLQDYCHTILNRKAKEYAKDEERLHNFIRCQKVYGGSLAVQVIDLRKKHSASIWDILDSEDKTYTLEYLDEKFGDYVNYTLLGFYADIIDKGSK